MNNNLTIELDKKQSFIEHFCELRNRLLFSAIFFFASFIICYYYSANIYKFLADPLLNVYNNEMGRRLIYTNLAEAFFTYMKVAFFAAFFISFPVIASQIYLFIAPGLYKHEKKAIIPFLIMAPILFILGAALVYYYIFPLAWSFFISFENFDPELPIHLEAKVSEYLSLVMHLIIAFGMAFQLPIILMLLAKTGLIDYKMLIKKRRIAIVIIFIFAAILTPPDIISQIGLALPLIILYELSIIGCRVIVDKSKKNA